MSKRGVSFLLVLLFLTSGCATFSDRQNEHPNTLSLETVEKIPLGSTTKDVRSVLGEPTKIQTVYGTDAALAWVYLDRNSVERATFIAQKDTLKISAKSWEVEDGDTEQKLENSLSRYPTVKFKKRELPWRGDYSPDEVYYEDLTAGISIEFRKTRQEVTSISWFLPKPNQESKSQE